MFPRRALLMGGAALTGGAVALYAWMTLLPSGVPRSVPSVLMEVPSSGAPWREGILLPREPCDTLTWIALDVQRISGERLLCGFLPPALWEIRIRHVWGESPPHPVRTHPEGWRMAPSPTWDIPTSSPRPFYVRVFWVVAFGVLFWGVARRVNRFLFREPLGWALLWGVLSVVNHAQILPALRGMALVERRTPLEIHQIFFHGPYWAVLLLQILVLWLALGTALERLRRKESAFLIQDFLAVFRGSRPRWIGINVWTGMALSLIWWGLMTPFLLWSPVPLRVFVDPFLLGGWFPGLHLLHRAFEMAFLALGLWLVVGGWRGRLPMGMLWGGLGLLGVGPLFPLPLAYTTVTGVLLRLGLGGLSALFFGFVLQRQGALAALCLALFAWMFPSSALLLSTGSWGALQVAMAWGLPLLAGALLLWRGTRETLPLDIPRLDPQTLETLLAGGLDARSFQAFLQRMGWSSRPPWWHLMLLCEEIYGIPVDLEVTPREIRIRIPGIRMVEDGVHRVLGLRGETEGEHLLFRFPRTPS